MEPSELDANLNCQDFVVPGCTDSSYALPLQTSGESPEEGSIECGLQPSEADFANRDAIAQDDEQACQNRRGWRKIVRNFTPSCVQLRLQG